MLKCQKGVHEQNGIFDDYMLIKLHNCVYTSRLIQSKFIFILTTFLSTCNIVNRSFLIWDVEILLNSFNFWYSWWQNSLSKNTENTDIASWHIWISDTTMKCCFTQRSMNL